MNKVVFSFRRAFLRIVCIVVAFVSFVSVSVSGLEKVASCTFASASRVGLGEMIRDFFGIKKPQETKDEKVEVILGGYPLGFTLECEGVIIVAIGGVQTIFGEERPLENKNVKAGDVLFSVDGNKITSATDVEKFLGQKESDYVSLGINRGGESFSVSVRPALEVSTNAYRLGLWIRDNAAGVGTLTYIKDDLRFGALGHPVTDIDTDIVMPVIAGNIYKCSIVGVNKGTRGNPGELRGLFLRSGQEAGTLDTNNDFGVYGTIKKEYIENNNINKKVLVGFKNSVRTGKAQIVSTIDGAEPEYFDIEIVKLLSQTTSDKKSMVIRVTDQRLIEKTGGIVQGMSGSPIIQDGKLVGAVTHVFVSDPTKGFGVYIDWMINN